MTYHFNRRGPRPVVHTEGPPCKTLATMTPEERAEMVRLYGPIHPDTKRRLERMDRIRRAAARIRGAG